MVSVTLFLNNDPNQKKTWRAQTKPALLDKVAAYIIQNEADVCASFEEPEDGGVPAYLLNYSEGYQEWEYRDRLDDFDCESGPLEKMARAYVESLDGNMFIKGRET